MQCFHQHDNSNVERDYPRGPCLEIDFISNAILMHGSRIYDAVPGRFIFTVKIKHRNCARVITEHVILNIKFLNYPLR